MRAGNGNGAGSSDSVVLLQYSEGKGHVGGETSETMETFVGLLRDKDGERWGNPVDDDVWLEVVKSEYLPGGMCVNKRIRT